MLFVCLHLYGCIPVAEIAYNNPELLDNDALDALIGARKETVLDRLGSPEQILSGEGSIYYLYSDTSNTFVIVILGFHTEDIRYCVLLEFNKEGYFDKYHWGKVAKSLSCDGVAKRLGAKHATDEVLLSEAKIGNAAAQWELYKRSKSTGVPDLRVLCEAAEQGDYRARWELGYIYNNGLYGVRKDLVLSIMWYSLVESDGHDPAGVDNIRKQLTPEQLTEAEHLYETWKPGQCKREMFGPE